MTRERGLSLLDWGFACRAAPGEAVSGDLHLVQPFVGGALVAAVDGLGHGVAAADAARAAVVTLQAHSHEPVLALLKHCHEALRGTRGVVLTLASFHARDGTMTWAGVGGVEGVLLRAGASSRRADLLLAGGVVGLHLPPLRELVLPVAVGDTLILATDGVRSGFADGLSLESGPQQLADRILARDAKGTDDALVLVARYAGGAP
jgi:serine phosphatase RsbU (regulator of sigma subunit)